MPDGRPKKRELMDVQALARAYTKISIQTLGGIAQNGQNDSARVAAAAQLLDRGWGKAAQPVTGKNGEEDIAVTIRTIIGERGK